jgi:hypothetical protein
VSRWGRFCCWMGLHKAVPLSWNAASACGWDAYCDRCDKRLLMDSRGDWFAA